MKKNQSLRIAQVAADYYRQAGPDPELSHFEEWLNTLNEPMRNYFRKEGFEGAKGVVDFRRFVAEQNGQGLKEYMRRHLSGSDYEAWLQQNP
ncbi:hypothetical protein DXT99_12130 [Pontibacter diazotrophicus]|uniref:Uncharacterized protein n=1 Tax=Pontibacter diazotrophicus TaxID=1400979 RepID=A0A3D8LC48_9BACT|nr:hypothetical protein [Pontibacter diazotrophicus]RDV15021.1 hypothetical protein DXT99_12130 [Pontibacter diazotrophicus]